MVAVEGSSSPSVALLVEDPELADAIAAAERGLAERVVVVPLLTADAGPLDLAGAVTEPTLGVMVLAGYLSMEISLVGGETSQLAGPGDILSVALQSGPVVPAMMSYGVVQPVRLAVLDRRFIAAVRRWPALLIALHQRLRNQEQRLAISAAIIKLSRVEDRVLGVLWQLAEEWGRVTTDGVLVPLALTHQLIGKLAGAKRPTVSLALASLAERGAVVRRPDGTYLLESDSWQLLQAGSGPRAEQLAERQQPEPEPERVGRPGVPDPALRARIAALHADFPGLVRDVEEILATSRAIAEENRQTRARLRESRARRR